MEVWSEIPIVVLVEILNYLPRNDIISCCSTCKQWRTQLFNSRFWRSVCLSFTQCTESEIAALTFLVQNIGRHIRYLTVSLSLYSEQLSSVNSIVQVLDLLPAKQLQTVTFRCHELEDFDMVHDLFCDENLEDVKLYNAKEESDNRPSYNRYWLAEESHVSNRPMHLLEMQNYTIIGCDSESRY